MAYEDPNAYQSNWVGAPQPAPSPLENLQAALRSGRIDQVEYENAVRSLHTGIGGVRPEEFTPGYEGEITFAPPSQQRTISPQQPPPVAAQPQPPAVVTPQAAPVQQQAIQPGQQEAVKSTQDFLTEGMPAVASPGEVAAEVGGPPKAWQLQQKFQALEPEEQASLKGAAWDAAPAVAASLASLALSWPKTAKEKETERIREEYKPGKAGRAAVLAHQQASGSSAGALGAQALRSIFAASAGQGLKTAANFTRNVREAGKFMADVSAAEQQVLAGIHYRAEADALKEYKGALDDPTASERRKAGLGKTLPALAAQVATIQGSQATSVYDDALANMTPEERIAWMKLPFEERKAMLATFSAAKPPAPAAEAEEA